MYSALSIAQYIIDYCSNTNKIISNLKLQKVLYFVQAEFLVDTGHPCFYEDIEAWDFGPVVPEVYFKFRIYGSATIPPIKPVHFKISDADRIRINSIVSACSEYTASQLVEITHNQTPWRKAYKKGRNSIISNDSIQKYFTEG